MESGSLHSAPSEVLALEYWQPGGHFHSAHPCRCPPNRQKGPSPVSITWPPLSIGLESPTDGAGGYLLSHIGLFRELLMTCHGQRWKVETRSCSRRGRGKRAVCRLFLTCVFAAAAGGLAPESAVSRLDLVASSPP